jgi:2'-5' RNA ligase
VKDDGVRTIGIAIAVPDPWGLDLQEQRAKYGDRLAWTIPTHITLLPPTQVPKQRLSEVDAHLAAVARATTDFEVSLDGSETFRPVTPTVFLRLAKGALECTALESQIRSGPLRRRLTFPYHPHVTLAFDVADEMLDLAFAEHADFRLTFRADEFSRYVLGEDGIWLPERDFVLGDSG